MANMCNTASTSKRDLGESFRAVRCDDDGYTHVINAPGNILDVTLVHATYDVVNLYLHKTAATPTLTSPVSVDDTVLNVNSNVGVVDGHAITIYEGSYISQSIVRSSTPAPGATITLNSPMDNGFTVSATVEVGPWNMNVQGNSGSPIIYSVRPPALGNFEIHTVNISMQDDSAMDSGKFGGIAQLSNGLVLRYENSTSRNLALLVNNIGFKEQSWETHYDDKAPAGVYGVTHTLNICDKFGVAKYLSGSDGDKLKIVVQDDLRDLSMINCVVGGHAS